MTVAELGDRMSAHELMEWAVFEQNFGPITVHERLDAAISSITYNIHASAGGKEPPEKFRVEWRPPQRWTDDNIISLFDAMAKR